MSTRSANRLLRADAAPEISRQNGGTLVKLAILDRLLAAGIFAFSLPFRSRLADLNEDARSGTSTVSRTRP
jgi:hypothetical protein